MKDVIREELPKKLSALAKEYARAALNILTENLTSVVLFGSVARGAFKRRELFFPVRQRLDPEVEKLWKNGICTDFVEIIRTEGEAKQFHRIYLDMTEEAVILFDRNGFFAEILERMRKKLRELGAQRKRMGRVWYWDLKPDYKPGDGIDLSL